MGVEEIAAKHAVDGCNIRQKKTVGPMCGIYLYHKDLSWVGEFLCCLPMHIMYNSFKIGSLRIHQLVRRILDIIMRPCLLFVVSVCCRCEGDGITYPLSGNRISVHYVGKLAATRQFQATGFREFSSWFSMGSVAPKKALQFRFGSKICPGKQNKTAKMLRIG